MPNLDARLKITSESILNTFCQWPGFWGWYKGETMLIICWETPKAAMARFKNGDCGYISDDGILQWGAWYNNGILLPGCIWVDIYGEEHKLNE